MFYLENKSKLLNIKGKTFAVAPMMDWTDRYCRSFHRALSQCALLYTEMITAQAIRYGDRQHLLGFDPGQAPVALQIGGSEPRLLAEATKWGEDFGYGEINLNVGCPSDRVQEGRFGACLMAEPRLVADCIGAMRNAVNVPVTVKCRIGIDDQDDDADLENFVTTVAKTGCRTFIVHARKAWLKGLSPRENREVPPLNYERVYRLKEAHPDLTVVLNGGIPDVHSAKAHLARVDGVMVGRAAYQRPWMLAEADHLLFGEPAGFSRGDAIERLRPWIAGELARGVKLDRITRHMMGLFHGEPGGRQWRRILSEQAHRPGAGLEVIDRALAVTQRQQDRLLAAE
jgi:tRNA-dihydrouridine synthase A